MLEFLNRYPVLLEDKSVKETKAILAFTSSTIKANFGSDATSRRK